MDKNIPDWWAEIESGDRADRVLLILDPAYREYRRQCSLSPEQAGQEAVRRIYRTLDGRH